LTFYCHIRVTFWLFTYVRTYIHTYIHIHIHTYIHTYKMAPLITLYT